MADKTIKQWLNTLEDKKVRAQAISNAEDYSLLIGINLHRKSHSLYLALVGSFVWGQSPEGLKYWQNISQNLP